MKRFWYTISHLGIQNSEGIKSPDEKRNIFFNQILFIGFFATVFQIAFVWPFIQVKALYFLVVCAILGTCLYLNSRNQFVLSKWFYIPSLYSMGLLTTLLVGGSALYHIQSLLIFMSCLILFDHRKERMQILLGIPFVIACLYFGEASLNFVPDFSDHWWNPIARFANITSLFSVSVILISFIINLNGKNENDLSTALHSLSDNAEKLKVAKSNLEEEVEIRTAKLRDQRNELQKQNEEKEVLLKEIHHRVRNNLQVIISLINLQLSKFDQKEIQEALLEVQNRVRSMALVHQRMYQTSNFKEVQLKDYARKIIENVSELYDDTQDAVLTIPDNVMMDFERAIPTGLIINEMVTNFYKHVNTGKGKEKHFELTLDIEANNGRIKYHDNGDGFPEHFKVDESRSLGLLLIESLVDQLDGDFKYYNDKGAVYEVTIPHINKRIKDNNISLN